MLNQNKQIHLKVGNVHNEIQNNQSWNTNIKRINSKYPKKAFMILQTIEDMKKLSEDSII